MSDKASNDLVVQLCEQATNPDSLFARALREITSLRADLAESCEGERNLEAALLGLRAQLASATKALETAKDDLNYKSPTQAYHTISEALRSLKPDAANKAAESEGLYINRIYINRIPDKGDGK